MNRAFCIILIPAFLVAVGYVCVFHFMGFSPGYPRLIIAVALLAGALWWLGRKASRRADPNLR